jgi:hypothetical protein
VKHHEDVSDEFAGWHRVGGHRLQFYATDAEIAEWLLQVLPAAFAPYTVLGQEWRDDRWQPFQYPLEDVGTAFQAHRGAVNWWIRSGALSPHVPPGSDKRHSFGGLILVQLGSERNGRLGDASIAIVDRIRHEVTGEERRQQQYLRIFERLRRSMRKRLVVATAYTFPDGRVSHDHWLMTARAADAHKRGEVRFDAEPIALREHS